jgi:uncharacterized protein (DUF302 family)
MTYGTTLRLSVPFAEAVQRVRDALADQGFGVLTEIDVKATMKAKLGADMEEYLILGACNPPLAHAALEADRSVGLLLPCNVVIRADGPAACIVEALDPLVIAEISEAPGVSAVAEEAAARLQAAVAILSDAHPAA